LKTVQVLKVLMVHLAATFVLLGFCAVFSVAPCCAVVSENLLENPSFDKGTNVHGVPVGWSLYGGIGRGKDVKLVELGQSDQTAIKLEDNSSTEEIGLTQTQRAKPGLIYEVSVEIRGIEGACSHGTFLQLRFLPSQKIFQVGLTAVSEKRFETVSIRGVAPPNTDSATVYLYTHRVPTPRVLLRNVKLVSCGSEAPPPPRDSVVPVYSKLKNIYTKTELVGQGKSKITIVVPASGMYDSYGKRIQERIKTLTDVLVPIVSDEVRPNKGHLIVLGNRSTNKTISDLYNRYYTLLDLRYPGKGGHVVRTLHNPLGDGHNVVFVGGSDLEGVASATDLFLAKLKRENKLSNSLSVGWIADIELGTDIDLPVDVKKSEIWEASKGYGSVGYFGWNSLSKEMAMYYMTGKSSHAREFIRLAFPTKEVQQKLSRTDGERIENKSAPLSGPYHYNAHMMILFWDLIEESPVFSQEERLRVTNAFSQQLNHLKVDRIYGQTTPPVAVGSRHAQWSAISLYCLGRYFQKDYPNPMWQESIESALRHFQPLHDHAWVEGCRDNLFWYNTGIAPILTYMLLTGDREPLRNGILETLLRGQEALISGLDPDWALNTASIGYLHKAAYLMQDGRYIFYRKRSGVDTDKLFLGQSFWPEEHLKPRLPKDLEGRWNFNSLPKPLWCERYSELPFDESFLFGSFRSSSDASGDFILIDGYNGSSRNPYHTFSILEFRLDGYTLLKGYGNQVVTHADGLVEPHIAMNAGLKYQGELGQTAMVVCEVPDAAFCNWKRSIINRTNRYALIVDDLDFRTDSNNMDVILEWETAHPAVAFPDGHLEFSAATEVPTPITATGGQVWPCDIMKTKARGNIASMRWDGTVKKGERRVFFSLLGIQSNTQRATLGCFRISDSAAIISLPSRALAVAHVYKGIKAELAIISGDHIYGKGIVKVSIQGQEGSFEEAASSLIGAKSPVDVDWNIETGALYISANEEVVVHLALNSSCDLFQNALRAGGRGQLTALNITPGDHAFEGALPNRELMARLATYLDSLFVQGTEKRSTELSASVLKSRKKLPPLEIKTIASLGRRIEDVITIPSSTGDLICAAEGTSIHMLSPDGQKIRTLKADGTIRKLWWWPEPRLLLAGCADEKVIAFDVNGKRKWVFISKMDPAVLGTGKTYWFKSAQGHEGIHGLFSGTFIDGKSQAFVGSACTLEIIDENGDLVRRMPQFWGKVSHFTFVDGPSGSLNLLASRKFNGVNNVAVINNQKLDPSPRGFNTVPRGATFVPGWQSMNRHHLIYEDLDGDGKKEVISDINGTWNRVTVWQADGKALYDANFGPGAGIPAKNMRGMDIADLDGDGKKEILVATSSGLVVALNHKCQNIWTTRLENAPTVLKCITSQDGKTPLVFVGCEDGSVIVLNGAGEPIRSAKVNGSPMFVERIVIVSKSSVVLLVTDMGEVSVVNLEN
jgi:outer membrane protein assembly factor BamB